MPSKSHSRGIAPDSKQESNPFHEKWVKSNQTLLRKRSQSAALATHSNKNLFHDRRIGEDDQTLDDDNRYLYRLQRERARKVRKRARFSLADDHEQPFDDVHHTHPDLVLPEHTDDADAHDSDADSEHSEDFIKLKENGGEDHHDDRAGRTHQEIMHEVVQKSKMYKAQRQQEKYATDEQTAKLDENLPELMTLLASSGSEAIAKQPKLGLSLSKPAAREELFKSDGKEENVSRKDTQFHYDDAYRKLASEKRSRPVDRLLTEEEKAERDRDRLIELEKRRAALKESIDMSDEEDDKKAKHRKSSERTAGVDDLDDDFGGHDSSSENSSVVEDDESDEERDGEPVPFAKGGQSSTPFQETASAFWRDISPGSLAAEPDQVNEEVAYVYKKCPATSSELQDVMKGLSVSQRDAVLDRIQKCFALTLNPGRNRLRLERLTLCLLFRIERLSELVGKRWDCALPEIDMLVRHVHTLGQTFEQTVSSWAKGVISRMSKVLQECREGLSSCWKVRDIAVARSIGRLYPCSDMRHPIVTPLCLMLSEALSVERMHSLADVALGVFVGSLILESVAGREGYSGELGRFIVMVFSSLRRDAHKRNGEGPGNLFSSLKKESSSDRNTCDSPLSLLDCLKLQEMAGGARQDSEIEGKVMNATLALTEGMVFSGRHRHMDIVLSELEIGKVGLQKVGDRVLEMMLESGRDRRFLSLYTVGSRKGVGRTLNPKYSAESGVYRKRPKTSFHASLQGDVTASASRVKRALRKEERGLARDVRREAQVAAASRADAEHIRDEDRNRRDHEVMSFLERQQASWKAAEKRQKKLSGKKW